MTASKIAYRKFLKSDFWLELSEQKKTEVGKCERCGSVDELQSHHVVYPKNWYDTTLEMLEVLCRKCHQEEHGIVEWSPRLFDFMSEAIEKTLMQVNKGDDLPSMENFALAASMVEDEEHRRMLGALLRQRTGLRIICASSKMWSSWLSKDREVKGRWFKWSRNVADKMIEVNRVG